MRGKEDTISRLRSPCFWKFEKLLDAIYLSVQEGGFALVVGLCDYCGEGSAVENGRAEELAALRDLGCC